MRARGDGVRIGRMGLVEYLVVLTLLAVPVAKGYAIPKKVTRPAPPAHLFAPCNYSVNEWWCS